MKKRAQVTIFILVAILIVAVIALYFAVRGNLKLGNTNTETGPIYNFVEDCIGITTENGLERIGEQGGYFFLPESKPSIDNRIPYYINHNGISFPQKEDIENNLAGFIYEELSFCILNFKEFRDEFNITHKLRNVSAEIRENKVRVNLDYFISVQREESGYQLEDFEVEIPIRLDTIYDTAHEIVNEQRSHLDSICLSCLYDLGEENEVHIDMLDYGEDTTIFTIIDDKSIINDKSYEFNFAIQYG